MDLGLLKQKKGAESQIFCFLGSAVIDKATESTEGSTHLPAVSLEKLIGEQFQDRVLIP